MFVVDISSTGDEIWIFDIEERRSDFSEEKPYLELFLVIDLPRAILSCRWFFGGLAFDVGVEVIYKIYICPELSLLSFLFREWNIYKVYIYIFNN